MCERESVTCEVEVVIGGRVSTMECGQGVDDLVNREIDRGVYLHFL